MPKQNTEKWCPNERGEYRRIVGKWASRNCSVKGYVFTFGSDKATALHRHSRVVEVWARVVELWKEPQRVSYSGFDGLEADEDRKARLENEEPLWDSESLFIAKELAKGMFQIPVSVRGPMATYVYVQRFQQKAGRFPMVHFVPTDAQAYEEGMQTLSVIAKTQLEQFGLSYSADSERPSIVAMRSSKSLHEALRAYIVDIETRAVEPGSDGKTLTPSGSNRRKEIEGQISRTSDCALASLDYEACQRLIDYWRMRPETQSLRIQPPRAVGIRTCQNHIKELIRFYKWLKRSRTFEWSLPEGFDSFETRVELLPNERTGIHIQERDRYLPSELAIINQHATPLERTILMLALNCGMRGAEQGTLLLDHLFLRQIHPHHEYLRQVAKYQCRPEQSFILYARNKTQTYGEFLLWPQTVTLLEWAIVRRNAIAKEFGLRDSNLLLTEQGKRFYRMTGGSRNRSQIFANKWRELYKRVIANEPSFPWFPFESLRDIAGDFIRQQFGDDVASVFLLHGKVSSDKLLDLYTKRPFAKVFRALELLEGELKIVFDAAPQNPCKQPMQQYKPTKTRERALEMRQMGNTINEIVDATGISRSALYRLFERHSRNGDTE